MKIVHLPFNVSSQIAVTIRAFQGLACEARGLAKKNSILHNYEGIEVYDWTVKPKGLGRLYRGLQWRLAMIRAFAWAEVIHWYWGDTTWRGLDLRIAGGMNKLKIVEFWGDDIRDPTIASADNPYLARMYDKNPELKEVHSQRTQKLFQRNGFQCLIPGFELSDYVDRGIFPQHYHSRARVFVADYLPRYPAVTPRKPLLVHAPSHQLRKGTEAVLAAVEQLRRTHEFDFKLLHQMPRSEALRITSECDVFLDQFTIGAEGLAAYEAMSLGKPVVCFIKPALRTRYPSDCPMVIANQDDLRSVLADLLQDGHRRRELGMRSRAYVEKYHDAPVIAKELLDLYRQLVPQR